MAAIGGFDIGSHRLDGDAVSSIFGNAIAVATAFLYAFIIAGIVFAEEDFRLVQRDIAR